MRESPDYSHLRVFGSKFWYVITKSKVKKLDARSNAGRRMGSSSQSEGYKIWDMQSSKLILSRDIRFSESLVDCQTAEIKNGNDKPSLLPIQGEKEKSKWPTPLTCLPKIALGQLPIINQITNPRIALWATTTSRMHSRHQISHWGALLAIGDRQARGASATTHWVRL